MRRPQKEMKRTTPTPGQVAYEARQDWLAYDNHCCAHCGQVPQQHHRDTRCYTAAEIGTRLITASVKPLPSGGGYEEVGLQGQFPVGGTPIPLAVGTGACIGYKVRDTLLLSQGTSSEAKTVSCSLTTFRAFGVATRTPVKNVRFTPVCPGIHGVESAIPTELGTGSRSSASGTGYPRARCKPATSSALQGGVLTFYQRTHRWPGPDEGCTQEHPLPDTPTPTPGEIAYETWATHMRLVGWPLPAFAEHEPSPAYQRAWEAAAQAVRDAWQTQQYEALCEGEEDA